MSKVSEIGSVLASIASNLLNPFNQTQLDFSISNLNRSLNPTTTTTTRVLDTALSLMCFTAPQVYDSAIECTIKTIVSVFTSEVQCRIDNDEVFRVGGSISHTNLVSLIDWCQHFLGRHNKDDLCYPLLYSVIRLLALTPTFICPATMSKSNLETNFYHVRDSFLQNVLFQLPTQIDFPTGNIPLRLLIWHLDPMILKQDMSDILREVSERPFLSLSTEFYDRVDWRSKLICLVMSPSLFVEARTLLHGWFLVVGLVSIMELLAELVVQMMDIISRPMRWGVSMEVGCKLPFSHAYFPHNHQWLRTLSGPISHDYFQHLLHEAGGLLQPSSNKAAKGAFTVDHKSKWAMAMNFPCWFCFASVMLFYENGSSEPFILNNVKVPSSVGAARYIAWIMNPIKESHQDVLVEHLARLSELWTLKRFNLNDGSRGQLKENRRLKLRGKSDITYHDTGIKTIWLWLKEFQNTYKYFEFRDGLPGFRAEGFSSCSNFLLNRIPFGILIGYLNHLNKDGCALILHYAAIGDVINFPESKVFERKQRSKYGLNEDLVDWSNEYTRAEAVAGCRIVFDITDLTETISSAMFDKEDEAVKFIGQLKLKTGDYLLQSMTRLLQLKFDGLLMQKDLLSRLTRWKYQGKDVHQGNKDFDRLCDSLKVS